MLCFGKLFKKRSFSVKAINICNEIFTEDVVIIALIKEFYLLLTIKFAV